MFNIFNIIYKKTNKNHFSMVLVLLIIIVLFPLNISAKMADYSKFDWDKFYEANKFAWGDICEPDDMDENGKCTNDGILKYQEKYYKKLYKVLAKYQKKGLVVSDDVIVTTTLFGLAVEYTGSPYFESDYKRDKYDESIQDKRSGILIDDNEVETDDIDDKFDDSEIQALENETDTINTLIKNAIAYYTYCYGIYGEPEKETVDGNTVYKCPDGGSLTKIYKHGIVTTNKLYCADNISATTSAKGYELGFWTYYSSKMSHDTLVGRALNIFGVEVKDEKYDECEEKKNDFPEGTMYQYTGQDDKVEKHVSYNKYFDFLKESRYFDRKPHLQYFFADLLVKEQVDCMSSQICNNSLEAKAVYDSYDDIIKQDRVEIIHGIIDVLNDNGIPMEYEGYGTTEFDSANYNAGERAGFYWPIGGSEIEAREVQMSGTVTTVSNNNGNYSVDGIVGNNDVNSVDTGIALAAEDNKVQILFADGAPQYTVNDVSTYFGERTSPITGSRETMYGIEIKAPEGTNVIAAYDGKVVTIKGDCVSGDYDCNDGYGNYVIISHSNGDYTLYGHLSSIENQISEGGSVMRGELIGKSGSTGATKEANLYYELRVGGNAQMNAVDPISNTPAGRNTPPDPVDLRPTGGGANSSVYGLRSPKFDGTSLTQSEFVGRLKDYCEHGSGRKPAAELCNNAELVYFYSQRYNVNPELVITRAMAEGNSPGGNTHNFWGIACYNEGGRCSGYIDLENGISAFAKIAQPYDTINDWQRKYAYIGKWWYNPGNSSIGGCYYQPHIKKYMSDQRQAETDAACAGGLSCAAGGAGSCVNTTDEDQIAYTTWQVDQNIGQFMKKVFGT